MRPGARAVRASLGLFALGVVVSIATPLLPVWIAAAAALGFALAADGLRLLRRPEVRARREVAESFPLGVPGAVGIVLENLGSAEVSLEVFDGCPAEAELAGLPRSVSVRPESGARIEYRLRFTSRGDKRFGRVEILRSSPWKLWALRERVGEEEVVRVYPNFAAVAGYALLALENRVEQMGIRKKPRRGLGLDFHQLREYREGDSLRQIDWKASSRRRQLVSREYQEERDQSLVFLLDCGRRMRATEEGLAHFDHCLNALLLVSYIALRQGDAVGFLTFGGPERWLKPVKGRAGMTALLNRVYDLEPTRETSDFAEAASRAMVLQRRRALVVIVTNLRDEDATDLGPALTLLRRRNLVVLASLRETGVDALRHAPIDGFEDALALASAELYLEERRRAISRLEGRHAMLVDVAPHELPVTLANRYLDVKRAGML